MKKFIAFITTALCIALFVGCGGSSSKNQSLYMSFEESVSEATNIFEGVFLGESQRNNETEYRFRVKKQIKGAVDEEEVSVTVPGYILYTKNGCISYDIYDEYTVGETYLLICTKQSSVYSDYDKYCIYSRTWIPTANIENAKIHNQSFSKNVGKEFADINELEEYITSLPQKNPADSDSYIKSDDLELIAKESDFLIQAEPTELVDSFYMEGTETYTCRVTEVYKGEITNDEIQIIFFADTVNIGEKYTVALSGWSSCKLFMLSSKNSLCTTEEQAEQMINAVKN